MFKVESGNNSQPTNNQNILLGNPVKESKLPNPMQQYQKEDPEQANKLLKEKKVCTVTTLITKTELSPQEVQKKDELITIWNTITANKNDDTLMAAIGMLENMLINADYSDPLLYQFFKDVGIRPNGGFFFYGGCRTNLYDCFKEKRENFAKEFFKKPSSVSSPEVASEDAIVHVQTALVAEFKQLGFPEEKIVQLVSAVNGSEDCSKKEALDSIFLFITGLQKIDIEDPERLTAFTFVDRQFTSKQGIIYKPGWYPLEEIIYATGYAKSPQKESPQLEAEKYFRGFISWSAGSNCHDNMPVHEEGFFMKDPMNNNQNLFFPNSEGAFQYLKVCHFYSKMTPEQQKAVAWQVEEKIKDFKGNFLKHFSNPSIAANIGQQGFIDISNWNESDWNDTSTDVMVTVFKEKFARPEFFLKLLASTITKRLFAYVKPHPIWGTGLDGKGENRLGKCLYITRHMLNKEIRTAFTSPVLEQDDPLMILDTFIHEKNIDIGLCTSICDMIDGLLKEYKNPTIIGQLQAIQRVFKKKITS